MIPCPALLALSLPEFPTLADNLQYQLTGLIVVFFTLGSLALLVGLIGRIFAAVERSNAGAAEPVPLPASAIAAAVSTTLGDNRFIIHGVKAADPRENLAWGAEGRRSIYASRKVR